MKPVSARTTGTFAQLKPVRSERSTIPRSRAPVAELGALDVSASEGRARPRHRDAVAATQQQRSRPARDGEHDLRLARSAAAVLDPRDAGAGADRLRLPADRPRRSAGGGAGDG